MAEQHSSTDLSRLVYDRRRELGLSLRDLAAASLDPETGEQLKYSWLHRLERGERVIPPELPQLRAFAAGLRLPLSVVQDAAGAQFHGRSPDAVWSQDASTRAVVARMEELSDEDRRALQVIVEAYARERIDRSQK